MEGGVDDIQVGNIGDRPFMKLGRIGFEAAVLVAVGLPTGVFVLANGVVETISAASASGASWVRVNMYNLAYMADEGLVESGAAGGGRLRAILSSVLRVFADVLVKHGSHLMVPDLSIGYHVRHVGELDIDAVVVSEC